jgi:hypothetical protein
MNGGGMAVQNFGVLPHHNPEDHEMNLHHHENLKFCKCTAVRVRKFASRMLA